MKLFTVVIPCHKDCRKAKKLAKKLKAEIVHNGCRRKGALPFGNKARAINYVAKKVKTPYVVVIDADIKLSPLCLKAFEREMKKGIKYGAAHQIFLSGKEKFFESGHKIEFNGACWFIKTNILRECPVPENVLVEDTAYHYVLKKKGIKGKTILDAIVFIDYGIRGFKSSFRQAIRYRLGSIQMMRVGIYRYALNGFISVFASLFVCWLFFLILVEIITIHWLMFSVGIVLSFVFWQFYKKKAKKSSLKEARFAFHLFINSLFAITLAPIIALYFFVRKKNIW